MNAEIQYLNILKDILDNGYSTADRTGTGTKSLFGKVIEHDYSEGFPLLTTKKMFTKGIIGELIWFLKGTENPQYLIDNKIRIWDEWMQVDDNGNKYLPHTYGVNWRDFHGFDQIEYVINEINNSPYSRRMVVSTWDAPNINKTALPWCHILFQFNIIPNEALPINKRVSDKLGNIEIAVYQRSCDWFLGVPFNIASYSFLLYMIGSVTNYQPSRMHYTFGNSHIYNNHIEQCTEQLTRQPYDLPSMSMTHKHDIDNFNLNDFEIHNYKHHPPIKGTVSV